MTNLERYNKIKKRTDRARKNADKADGALTQITQQLKDDFDCASIEDAQKLLKKHTTKRRQEIDAFGIALDKFEEEFGSLLDD